MDGEPLEPGRIYVAPRDHHLLVDGNRLRLGRGAKENLSRPAVDPLFRTAATSRGPRVIAVILSGWLNDGAAGCVAVQRCNGLVVVQDPSTQRIGEMATNVMKLIRVDHVLPIEQIAPMLVKLARESHAGQGAFTVPDDVRIETEISRNQSLTPNEKLQLVEKLGSRTPLTCPECNGSLWQLHGEPLRYRCHVGHAFSAEALSEEQASAIEASLWSAVRALEEQTLTTQRLANLAKARDDLRSAEKLAKRAAVAQEHAKVINQLILQKIVQDPHVEEE